MKHYFYLLQTHPRAGKREKAAAEGAAVIAWQNISREETHKHFVVSASSRLQLVLSHLFIMYLFIFAVDLTAIASVSQISCLDLRADTDGRGYVKNTQMVFRNI